MKDKSHDMMPAADYAGTEGDKHDNVTRNHFTLLLQNIYIDDTMG